LEGEVRRKAALVADIGARPAATEQLLLEGMEDFGDPMRTASSEAVSAPTGITMNSWMSIGVVGVGAAVDDVHHRHGQDVRVERRRRDTEERQTERACAAALAQAMETPRMALAPSFPCSAVPSSSIMVRSIRTCSVASTADDSASKISPLTLATALRTPLPP
jgi:hypothetical protein